MDSLKDRPPHWRPVYKSRPGLLWTIVRAVLVCVPAVLLLLCVVVGLMNRSRGVGGRRASCLSQVRQVGLAMRMYADQHSGHFPTDRPASRGIDPMVCFEILCRTNYLDDSRVLKCPADVSAVADPFDPDDRMSVLYRRNCSYSVNVLSGVTQASDPATALLSDEPEFVGVNSVNHRYENSGPGPGQNVFLVGGVAKWLSTPASGPDPNIFRRDPASAVDAWIVDTGP